MSLWQLCGKNRSFNVSDINSLYSIQFNELAMKRGNELKWNRAHYENCASHSIRTKFNSSTTKLLVCIVCATCSLSLRNRITIKIEHLRIANLITCKLQHNQNECCCCCCCCLPNAIQVNLQNIAFIVLHDRNLIELNAIDNLCAFILYLYSIQILSIFR